MGRPIFLAILAAVLALANGPALADRLVLRFPVLKGFGAPAPALPPWLLTLRTDYGSCDTGDAYPLTEDAIDELNATVADWDNFAMGISWGPVGTRDESGWCDAALNSLRAVDSLGNPIDLSGGIPPALSALTGVSYLALFDAGLDGSTDFTPLGGMAALGTLTLADNAIDGSVDLGILGYLTSLSELNLHRNQLAGASALDSLATLTSLTELNLHTNLIGPTTDLAALGNLTALSELNLSSNQLDSGNDFSAFVNLTALETLRLDGNLFAEQMGEDAPALCSVLKGLRTANASFNVYDTAQATGNIDGLCDWTGVPNGLPASAGSGDS